MASELNKVIAGEYNLGDAIVYGDTDSDTLVQVSIPKKIFKGEVDWSKDNIIAYYDAVCEEVNKTFHVL